MAHARHRHRGCPCLQTHRPRHREDRLHVPALRARRPLPARLHRGPGGHGITPIRRVLTDNGACYRSRTWAAAFAAEGTKHKRTRPSTPRTNGEAERYDATRAREWASVRNYTSEHERRTALADVPELLQPRAAARRARRPTAHQPDLRR
ncbi:DDE-type integrase/transposase/recombinase [Streptomyces sp. NA02950]|nr:DDE-type integrase/transposase/recombinase [Streptomyces sp. NA02950]